MDKLSAGAVQRILGLGGRAARPASAVANEVRDVLSRAKRPLAEGSSAQRGLVEPPRSSSLPDPEEVWSRVPEELATRQRVLRDPYNQPVATTPQMVREVGDPRLDGPGARWRQAVRSGQVDLTQIFPGGRYTPYSPTLRVGRDVLRLDDPLVQRRLQRQGANSEFGQRLYAAYQQALGGRNRIAQGYDTVYQKEVDGLMRGNDALIKRYGAQVLPDEDTAWARALYYRSLSPRRAASALANTLTFRGDRVLPALSQMQHWTTNTRPGVPKIALGRYAGAEGAMVTRHEVDEMRSMVKPPSRDGTYKRNLPLASFAGHHNPSVILAEAGHANFMNPEGSFFQGRIPRHRAVHEFGSMQTSRALAGRQGEGTVRYGNAWSADPSTMRQRAADLWAGYGAKPEEIKNFTPREQKDLGLTPARSADIAVPIMKDALQRAAAPAALIGGGATGLGLAAVGGKGLWDAWNNRQQAQAATTPPVPRAPKPAPIPAPTTQQATGAQ